MPLETSPTRPDPRLPEVGFPDNPDQEGLAKMKDADGPFFLCQTNVGPFKPGDVVTCKELGPHAQVGRLFRLGAVAIAPPEHAEAYRKQLAAQPGSAPAVGPAKAADAGAAEVPNATQKVELSPGGGFNQPPKAGDKK